MTSSEIASIINCTTRTFRNILRLFRETNNVIEREGRGCTLLNNRKRVQDNIIIYRLIENFVLYQRYSFFSIIYFLEGSNFKKQRKKCRFLVLVDWGCVHCTQIFFSINEYKKISKYTG